MKRTTHLLPLTLLIAQSLSAQKIYNIAGNGYLDYSGNGGLATAAQFYNPNGVAKDDSGNIYIVDQGNNCIRRINYTNGRTVLFAGNTFAGYKGDGGPAVSAELNSPAAVACDPSGNVYIADEQNSLIREVTIATRKINYVAGYVSGGTPVNGYVQTQDGGLATHAELNHPDGLAISPYGDIYIADRDNQRIRKVTGGNIITICGRDSIVKTGGGALLGPNGLFYGDGKTAYLADVDNPAGLALDSLGNLYIADQGNYRIRIINTSGIINTISGSNSPVFNGDHILASNANLNPAGVAIGRGGNIYIADQSNNRIRMINAKTDTIYTLAGNGTASYGGDGGYDTNAILNGPTGIFADDSGRILVCDAKNMRIREIQTNDTIVNIAGCGTGGYSGNWMPALGASTRYPNQLTLDAAGNLYFADKINNAVREIKKSGADLQNDTLITVAGNGTLGYSGDNGLATSGELFWPSSVAVDKTGIMYIADVQNNVVRRVKNDTITTFAGTGTGGYSGDSGPATAAELFGPYSVAVDTSGNVYVADNKNYRIRKINKATGIITTVAGNGIQGYNGENKPATAAELSSPVGVAVDTKGNLYISDPGTALISKVNTTGTITTIAGNGFVGYWGDAGPATAAEFDEPAGLSVDKTGNVFVADSRNNVIREITSAGVISTVVGKKDTTITRIIKIVSGKNDTTYDTTYAGIGGYNGNGIAPTLAELNQPQSVFVDNSGNLYISDFGNQRIREVTTTVLNEVAQIPTLVNRVLIYPNPSGGRFMIQSPVMAQVTEVFNILGDKIASMPSAGGLNEMNLSTQPAGIYLYRVMSQSGALLGSGKLVISK